MAVPRSRRAHPVFGTTSIRASWTSSRMPSAISTSTISGSSLPSLTQNARALADLIDRLTPDLTTVLLQAGRTSVHPPALAKFASKTGRSVELRSVSRPDDAWIHAKLFVVQTPTGAICLQGSANASDRRARATDPDGNFEMANLLRRTADAFDDVLGGLQIGDPVADAAALDLTYPVVRRQGPSRRSWMAADWRRVER